jgi:hypothetical protein
MIEENAEAFAAYVCDRGGPCELRGDDVKYLLRAQALGQVDGNFAQLAEVGNSGCADRAICFAGAFLETLGAGSAIEGTNLTLFDERSNPEIYNNHQLLSGNLLQDRAIYDEITSFALDSDPRRGDQGLTAYETDIRNAFLTALAGTNDASSGHGSAIDVAVLREDINRLTPDQRSDLVLDIAQLGQQFGLVLPATQVLADAWGAEGKQLHLDVLQVQYNLSAADAVRFQDLWRRHLNGEDLSIRDDDFVRETIGSNWVYGNASLGGGRINGKGDGLE